MMRWRNHIPSSLCGDARYWKHEYHLVQSSLLLYFKTYASMYNARHMESMSNVNFGIERRECIICFSFAFPSTACKCDVDALRELRNITPCLISAKSLVPLSLCQITSRLDWVWIPCLEGCVSLWWTSRVICQPSEAAVWNEYVRRMDFWRRSRRAFHRAAVAWRWHTQTFTLSHTQQHRFKDSRMPPIGVQLMDLFSLCQLSQSLNTN